MLDTKKMEEELFEWEEAELIYRLLFERCRPAFAEPIRNWQEFRRRLPFPGSDSPPSPIREFLTEAEFFPDSGTEVNCFKNMRYCPAFLHKLEFIKIVYILSGNVEFYLNGRKYLLHTGNFCIVSPGVEQAVFAGEDEGIAVNLLLRASTFTRAFSAVLMEQGIVSDFFWKMSYTKYSNRVLLFASEEDATLKNTVLRLFYEAQREEKPSNLLLKSYVSIFLGEVIRGRRGSLVTLEGLDENVYRIPEILRQMKEKLADITLKDLADSWNMSESQMNYDLKMETGYSFSYLIADLRLQKSADLLVRTSESVERIMEAIGYQDSASFYRNFKKRYGMTPQTWRDQGRREITG